MSSWRKLSGALILVIILVGFVIFYFSDRTGNDFSEADVPQIERAFTEEEVALKSPEVPWHAWAYSIGVHEISAAKNGTVKFFGKVVSEDGEPLSGVSLVAEVTGSEPSFVKSFVTGDETYVRGVELMTDQNGKFEITDFVGRRLTISDFEKQGYVILGEKELKGMAPRKSWSYSFIANSPSSFRSDPENPEVFTMKKIE